MTVSISKIDINYYLSQVAVGDGAASNGQLTSYYTESGAPAGHWYGTGLTGLNMEAETTVTKEAAIRMYEEAKTLSPVNPWAKHPSRQPKAPPGLKPPPDERPRKPAKRLPVSI